MTTLKVLCALLALAAAAQARQLLQDTSGAQAQSLAQAGTDTAGGATTAQARSQAAAQGTGQAAAAAQAIAGAEASGNAQALSQAYAQSVSQGQTGAAAQALAQGAAAGGSQAQTQAKALSQAFATGGGTAQAAAQAAAEAYGQQPEPVKNALADAITTANGDPASVDEAARIIAQALVAGGNQAKVFGEALAAAVTKGGCGAIDKILPKLEPAAREANAASDAVATALEANGAGNVLSCLYTPCSGTFGTGDCCSQGGSTDCGCVGTLCRFRRVTRSPLVWEARLGEQRCVC